MVHVFSVILDADTDAEENSESEEGSTIKTPKEMIQDAAKLMMASVMPIINKKLVLRDAIIIEKIDTIYAAVSQNPKVDVSPTGSTE